MHISIKWFNDQFNFSLHSAEGKPEFLTVKGCRIVNGSKGQFVSGPSTKKQDGSYWNHVFMGEKFADVILRLALDGKEESAPKPQRGQSRNGGTSRHDDDVPF